MENYDIYEDKKIQFCAYCHNIIEENEPFINSKGSVYHLYCWKQMNTYYDDLDFYDDFNDVEDREEEYDNRRETR